MFDLILCKQSLHAWEVVCIFQTAPSEFHITPLGYKPMLPSTTAAGHGTANL